MQADSDLIRAARAALRDGDREEAAALARVLLTREPEHVKGWALLSQATEDDDEARYALGMVMALSEDEKVLDWAQRRLARLDAQAAPPSPRFTIPIIDLSERQLILIGGLIIAFIMLVVVIIFITVEVFREATPTPTAIVEAPSPTPWPTRTPLPTRTPVDTPTPAATGMPRPTSTPLATRTPSSLPTMTLTPGPPAAFQLLEPAANGITRRADPLLSWQPAPGAARYNIRVEAPDGRIIEQTMQASACGAESCELSISGSVNGVYRWQVSAQNDLGSLSAGPSTFIRSFIPAASLELGGQVPNSLANHALMRSAGMSWVKFQINWPATSIGEVGSFVQAGREQGFRVLLSITGPFRPSSVDAAGYVNFMAQVAALRPDAIEVWNEPNIDSEWPAGQIDPAVYVRDILAPSYRVIKENSPDTMVISAGLASSGVHNITTVWSDDNYVRGMNNAGATRYADCMGFHHNSMATSPSARSGHPGDDGRNHYSWYFIPTADLYWRGFGGVRPLCLTEVGALSGDGLGPLPEAWNWASGTSADEQALWLAETVDIAQARGHIRLMIIWNVDYPRFDSDPQAGFAILRPGGVCPACDLLRQALSG